VLKALRKEPAHRYPTVEAFSEDIGRYLDGLPVGAARGTALYRASKFVRRNRVAVVAVAAAVALAAAFAVDRGIQARRLTRERDRGQRVTAFLIDLFRIADPGEARGNTVTAREVLDTGTARLETELKDEPEVRAALLDTVSQVHSGLGLYGKAVALARAGLETRRRVLGERHPDVAASLVSLGDASWENGDNATAESCYRESLAIRRALYGPEHPAVAASLQGVARSLRDRGDYPQAEELYRQALAMQRRLLGDAHADVASSLNGLARLLRAKGDYAGAEALHRECLDLRRRLFGSSDRRVVTSLNNLAVVLYLQGKPEALLRFRENLAAARTLVADGHPLVTASLVNLAGAVAEFEGDYDEADALAVEVLRRERAQYGDAHAEVARALDNRARHPRRQGRSRRRGRAVPPGARPVAPARTGRPERRAQPERPRPGAAAARGRCGGRGALPRVDRPRPHAHRRAHAADRGRRVRPGQGPAGRGAAVGGGDALPRGERDPGGSTAAGAGRSRPRPHRPRGRADARGTVRGVRGARARGARRTARDAGRGPPRARGSGERARRVPRGRAPFRRSRAPAPRRPRASRAPRAAARRGGGGAEGAGAVRGLGQACPRRGVPPFPAERAGRDARR
jgi:tetratricopeptide (TPR) repeat protein